MNKSELIDAMAAKSGMKKTESAAALDAFIEAVGDALKKGDQVTLVGFGTFLVREREARTGRNPRSGETIEIAASRLPSFKAGKGLKDRVN
jgi:DNA-binding protein HU-beta